MSLNTSIPTPGKKTLLLWITLGGGLIALLWGMVGIACCCTGVFYRWGHHCLRIALFILYPEGKVICYNESPPTTGWKLNAWMLLKGIWMGTAGLFIALTHLSIALLLWLSWYGRRFAQQHLYLAQVALYPFDLVINQK